MSEVIHKNVDNFVRIRHVNDGCERLILWINVRSHTPTLIMRAALVLIRTFIPIKNVCFILQRAKDRGADFHILVFINVWRSSVRV